MVRHRAASFASVCGLHRDARHRALATLKPLTDQKRQLVWEHPLAALSSPGWRGIGNYKVLTVALLLFLGIAYGVLA